MSEAEQIINQALAGGVAETSQTMTDAQTIMAVPPWWEDFQKWITDTIGQTTHQEMVKRDIWIEGDAQNGFRLTQSKNGPQLGSAFTPSSPNN